MLPPALHLTAIKGYPELMFALIGVGGVWLGVVLGPITNSADHWATRFPKSNAYAVWPNVWRRRI